MKKHYLTTLLILFYAGNAAALPDCPSSGYFDNCYGAYEWDNGDNYIGEWRDDKVNGQGAYYYANGDEYVGEYKDGKKHGQGTYTYADGTAKRGYFSNDELVFDICEGEGLIKASDEFTTTKGFDEFITVANAFFDYYAQCVFKLMDD